MLLLTWSNTASSTIIAQSNTVSIITQSNTYSITNLK